MSRKKVLFLVGSPNQTTQMHQIARLLEDEFEPYFSQLYYNGWQRGFYQFLLKTGGLVVCCSNVIVPWPLVRRTKTIFVQEGMTDPLNWWARLVRKLNQGVFKIRVDL